MFVRITSAVLVAVWLAAVGGSPAAASPSPVPLLASAAPAEHGDGKVDPMAFQRDLALWTGVIFVVLFLVLAKFAWRPIADGLDNREKFVAGQIAQALQQNEEARRLLDEYHRKLAASQDEVRAIFDQARRDAEGVGREVIDKARQEAHREKDKAVHEIELASTAAMKELAELSAALAVQLAGKIVGTRLQAADHAKLIQQAVANFVQAKPGQN